ncbi:alpha/beta fold hydrolase [Methylocella sp. CPCC 101449]|uniref:alpha/beta fold hydrolase n=1 Tax=Methylocella sp. CPCC 101449 TaxID=2987531 RepID=UPI00288D8F9E|nr:alpha/beta fold hydrolase [Methylocella sp. CPCC 101449]MDT2020310.1 alpha/beta hydrolase [Methylocella sp. CPCC 101449]
MKSGQYVTVDGARTHYYEAGVQHRGVRASVLLLHSGEFGGCAEFSWEHNIEALASRYHVLAPDHLGFGRTDKLFDFENMMARRIRHIQRFIEIMGTGPVHVMGSSMSGGLCLMVAARETPDWPLLSVTCCSGGGVAPDNEARKVLNSYDGSKEHMRRIIEVMFVDPKWAADDAYIDRRVAMANATGAWEAIAAARFKAPFHQRSGVSPERDALDYARISIPVLVFAGRRDPLRNPGYTDDFVPKMPRAELHFFENAAHMGNIEYSHDFNARTLKFLAQQEGAC